MNKFKVGQYVVVTNKTLTHYNTVLRIIENDEYNKCCLLDKDRNLWYSYEDLELFSKEETKSNCETNKVKNSNVSHYDLWNGFEAIDLMKQILTKEEYIGYLKGNILKYQLRLSKKDNVDKEIVKIKDYTRELNSMLEELQNE